MTLVALLLGASLGAQAATWSAARPLAPDLEPEGHLVLPAGVALRLEPGRDAPLPRVVELPSSLDPETGERVVVDGPVQPVDLRGISEGLLVPAAETTRLLVIEPGAGRLSIRTTTRQDELASWLRVVRHLDRARPAQLDALELPWGSPAVLAALRLRARAVSDRSVRALGTAHDLAALVPLHRTTHASPSLVEHALGPDQPWTVRVEGPATAVVRVRPQGARPGTWVRGALRVGLGEAAPRVVELAGSGAQVTEVELFVPPGEHELAVALPGLEAQASLELARLRPPLLGVRPAGPAHVAGDAVSAAELAWLRGDRAAAREAWRALLDQPGPTGELARLRLLQLAVEPAELHALADLPPELSPDAVEACVDAVLAHAEALPAPVVEAALRRAARPDVARVAAWLDGLGGQRPRGAALLRAARPLVDDGQDLYAAELRHRALRTRFRDLSPDSLSTPTTELRTAPPGTPRVLVPAGEGADLLMPEWSGRTPVLRLSTVGPTTWTLDGQPWSAAGGALGVGLEPGLHRLEVQSGAILVMDREVARGGHLVYEATVHALPATWGLPDPGARVDLRLSVDPPVPLRAELDDGVVAELHPDGNGRVDLVAGAWTSRLHLEALADPGGPVRVAVQQRERLPGVPGPPPTPVADLDAALQELADLSRAIDLGYPDARLARAALLGRLGLATAARRDLLRLLAQDDPALRDAARTLADNLLPATPSAPAPGPTTVDSALAAHGAALDLPALPIPARAQALEEAAAALAEPALLVAAAEAWQEAGEPVRAWRAAEEAGAAGADLRASLEARTPWTWLRYAQGGAGMVRVPEPPEDPTRWPTWRRARAAMLAAPWEGGEESLSVLRGGMAEVLRVPAGELRLSLLCRDEQGPGAPCVVPLRLGEAAATLTIPDGAVEELLLPLAGEAEVEVGGPGAQHAVVVQAAVDGEPVQGQRTRSALRASAARPVEIVVGGPVLVRVESMRGAATVRLDGAEVGPVALGAPRVLAIPAAGPHSVSVRGDADVRLYVADALRPRDEALGALLPLSLLPPDAPPPVDVDAIFEQLAAPAPTPLRTPGRGGSTELALAGLRELVYSPSVQGWTAAELGGHHMRASDRAWLRAGGWLRGPHAAGGGLVEGGPAWSRGFAQLRADAAVGDAVQGAAGEVGATARARHDLSLGRTLDLRLDGRLRAAWSTPAPALPPVDNRAWSRWRADHPVHLVAAAALVGSPARDLRWELGLRAVSNTGPSLDRLGPVAGVDLLLPTGTVLSTDGRLEWRFADTHRREAALGGQATLRVEQDVWDGERRWWRAWGEVGARLHPDAVVGAAGLRLLLGPSRGLRDLPPGSLPFRSLRDLP